MKSISHYVKKKIKIVQDIVRSQDSVVVVAFFFCLEKLYIIKQLLTIAALDMM